MTSGNGDVSLQETNKENLQEVKLLNLTNTPVQNLHVANAQTEKKEEIKKNTTEGVSDLALMITDDKTVTQAKELLPPQHNAAPASNKVTNQKLTSDTKDKQSKHLEEGHKHNVLPQGHSVRPGANKKSEIMTMADT